jgi:hypothetical protein
MVPTLNQVKALQFRKVMDLMATMLNSLSGQSATMILNVRTLVCQLTTRIQLMVP